MSRESDRQRSELGNELRQFQGLSASVFRTAAAERELTATDAQVLDILGGIGLATAGQLADLTGLTTGAITGMLNRLEAAGLLSRQRDPSDGRRVIVRPSPETDPRSTAGPLPASLVQAWDDLISGYSDEQIALLLTFLKRANTLSREAIARAHEPPVREGHTLSAPLGNLTSGRLVVASAVSQLRLSAADIGDDLYRATFDGPWPKVTTRNGAVTIHYSGLWRLTGGKRGAEVILSTAVPWQVVIRGGASAIEARLSGLDLAGLEFGGGGSGMDVALPVPSRAVPIRISGGASEITIRRPAGVPARAHLKGWASQFVFDGQTYSPMSKTTLVHSPDYDVSTPRYDIEVASPASMVTITTY